MSMIHSGTRHLYLARLWAIQPRHSLSRQSTSLFVLRNETKDYASTSYHRFSTLGPLFSEPPRNNAPNEKPGPPELPKFSLEALGLSRRMKLVVLVLFSIAGTIETWFYAQAALRWWRNRSKNAEDSEDVSASVD